MIGTFNLTMQLQLLGLKVLHAGGTPVEVIAKSTHPEAFFYFRARGDGWTISIGGSTEDENLEIWLGDRPGFYREGNWGPPGSFDASWMPDAEVYRIVAYHYCEWYNQQRLKQRLEWVLESDGARAKQYWAKRFVELWRSVSKGELA